MKRTSLTPSVPTAPIPTPRAFGLRAPDTTSRSLAYSHPMRIAYLSPHLSTVSTGGSLFSRTNLALLAAVKDVEVTAYAVSRIPAPGTVPVATTASRLGTAMANLRGLCATLSATGRRQFLDAVRREQPDVIWLDSSLFGSLVASVRHLAPRARVACCLQNIEQDLLRQRISEGHYAYLPALLATERSERLSTRTADLLIAITPSDSERLRSQYGRGADFVLPVSLADRHSDDDARPALTSSYVVFVGSDFPPNIEALRYLNEHVAPKLAKTTIAVVGKGLQARLGARAHPRLEFHGYVEDLASIYRGARLSLAPVTSGGGMKVKIAESLMYGRAVVSTSFAAVGYEAASSDAVRVADDTDEFVQLIENWTPVDAKAPRRDYIAHYSFLSGQARVHDIVAALR